MKNFTRIIGIAALVAVIGFVFAACGGGGDSPGPVGGGGGGGGEPTVVEEGTILPAELRGTLWKDAGETSGVKITADGTKHWQGPLANVLAETGAYRYSITGYKKYSDGSYWYIVQGDDNIWISGNTLTLDLYSGDTYTYTKSAE